MSSATVNSKVQIIPPKEATDHQPEGDVQIQPLRGSVQKLFGILHQPGMRATSLAEMDRSLIEALAEDDARIRRSGELAD